MIQKIFHLRVCDDTVFKNRERPCILYQIKRCSGPCVGYVKKEEYNQTVEDAIEFVSGKSRKIQKNLSNQMEKASEDLDFEKAVILRDRIKALNIIQSSQRINEANLVEADVIAGYKESGKTCIQVFFYRSKQIGAIKLFSQNTIQMKSLVKSLIHLFLNFMKIKVFLHRLSFQKK